MTKKYLKEDFTILWRPQKCIHAAVCVQMLPDVYDPQQKPWIKPENASVEELKKQINACPSGALAYEDGVFINQDKMQSMIKLTVRKNGPIIVTGEMEITGIDGEMETKSGVTAICRCGASTNKPYCDGSHAKIEFKG